MLLDHVAGWTSSLCIKDGQNGEPPHPVQGRAAWGGSRGQDVPGAALLQGHLHRRPAADDSGLVFGQGPENRRQEPASCHLGHRGAGALPRAGSHLLQGCRCRAARLRHHRHRLVQQGEDVGQGAAQDGAPPCAREATRERASAVCRGRAAASAWRPVERPPAAPASQVGDEIVLTIAGNKADLERQRV
eukprot:3732154-Prymnesium_polylepis.1